MGFILLWIAAILAAWLILASALTARHHIGRCRWLLTGAGLVGPMLVPGAAYALMAWARSALELNVGWTVWETYFAAWLIVYAIGAVVMVRKLGFKYNSEAPHWGLSRLAAAAVFFLALVGFTFWNLDNAARDTVETLRAEVDARTRLAFAMRPVTEANAAPFYLEAFEVMEFLNTSDPQRSDDFDAWSEEENSDYNAPAFKAMHEPMQPVLAQLRAAAAMPVCDFEHDYSKTFAMMMPEIVHFKRAADWLRHDALAAAHKKNFRRAFENIVAQCRLARHITGEPLVISYIIGAAIEQIAAQTMTQVLAAGSPDADAILVLNDLPSTGLMRVLQRALRYETSFGLSAIVMISDGSVDANALIGPGAFSSKILLPFWRVFMLKDEVVGYRYVMDQYARLATRPYAETRGKWGKVGDRDALRRQGILTGLLLPTFGKIDETEAQAIASHRLMRFARGVLRNKVRTGAWPKAVHDLTQEDLSLPALDPFTGKPLQFERSEKEIILRALGPNGKRDAASDDAKAKPVRSREDDIVLRIPIR